MNKVCLKQDIFIEGFDSNQRLISNQYLLANNIKLVLYSGKTSEIPEELAKKYADCFKGEYYLDYSADIDYLFEFKSAKESIQSACQSEFCIIYKTN